MKEKQLVKKLRKKLILTVGGVWIKIHGGPYQHAGLSDLIGCVDGRFIVIEVKLPGKLRKVTELQQHFIDSITAAGGLAFATDGVISAVKRVKKWLKR